MRIRFNKSNIKNLEPKSTRYEVADLEIPALRLRVTPGNIKTFVLLYRNAQNRQKRYTIGKFGDVTPESARITAGTLMAKITLGGDPAAEKQEEKRKGERLKYSTLKGFLENKFRPWAEANRKTGSHMAQRIESAFSEFLDKPLEEISPWLIEKWRKGRFKQGRTVGTVNRDIATLKSCLSRAVDWHVIDENPLRRLKLSREDRQGVVRYLSPDEEKRLLSALNDRDIEIKSKRTSGNKWRRERRRPPLPEITSTYSDHLTPMVVLSLNTGMRRGEVFHLQWRDIDFANKTLVVRGEMAKSGKTRHINLNETALSALQAWQRQCAPSNKLVFPGRKGNPLDNIRKSWEGLLERANIQNFRWHDMRHHFASKLVMAGVDLNTVRELLGHADIKMTLRYAHLAPEHKAAAVAKLVEI
ncbi:MAG: site-specific integrase [Candidatus Thiodiazotropha endolucinida]|uniref:Site-specific integrase n=1 Tax=Candidatus Thiodiazotropha taylori TaxID=2792791 RepID=A0A9E4NMY8_9GAMM|nr:site-specific integrase [Candidatus Thiodiazotropha taylori]MCW4238431.1 site-specific integrase [Candidatus Thiodiazotropha endolucinida]